jgi:hypothetical protein
MDNSFDSPKTVEVPIVDLIAEHSNVYYGIAAAYDFAAFVSRMNAVAKNDGNTPNEVILSYNLEKSYFNASIQWACGHIKQTEQHIDCANLKTLIEELGCGGCPACSSKVVVDD